MAAAFGPSRLDPLEDLRLVNRCLAGDRRAWEALVRRHERLVLAVARSYQLSDADLGDVFQEVFAALVRGLPRLREPRTLVRWLSSTTQRVARATALRRRREAALTHPEPGVVARLAAGDVPVGADLERLEEQALVRLALQSLAPRCRRLLAALYYEEPPPSYAEIARRLGIAVGSIGPTRARCFDRLRAALERIAGYRERISDAASPTFEPDTGESEGFRLGSFGEEPGLLAGEDHA
jgi:RNA polymerase sigma factor (sigma-70 family)